MNATDGGGAFPKRSDEDCQGMSLMDYFAGQALPTTLNQFDTLNQANLHQAAMLAYQAAAEMLCARNVACAIAKVKQPEGQP